MMRIFLFEYILALLLVFFPQVFLRLLFQFMATIMTGIHIAAIFHVKRVASLPPIRKTRARDAVQ